MIKNTPPLPQPTGTQVIVFFLLLCAAFLVFSSCARAPEKGDKGDPGAPGVPGITTPATPPTAIQQIVDSYNAWRKAQGQSPITPGLNCQVQAIASGTYLWSGSPGYTSAQAISLTGPAYNYLLNAPLSQADVLGSAGNGLIDALIRPIFLNNNYRIVCQGFLVVTQDGYYSLTTTSDDGSVLFIDGAAVVVNDGAHGAQTVPGARNLQSAVPHSIVLYYAQSGGGNIGLEVKINGSVIPAANLYH